MANCTKANKEKSFHYVYRLNMFMLALIIGIIFIGFQVISKTITSKNKIYQEITAYQEQVKSRIKDEVEKAVYIAGFYYSYNQKENSKEQIQQDIIQLLENINSNDVGYYFAADYQGNNIIGPSKGSNVYNIEDKNGLKVVQTLIETAKEGGGFVEYIMPPLEGVEQVPKISYVLPFEPYGWYIGAGVNLYEIEIIQEQIRDEYLKESFWTISINSLLILLVIVVFNRFSDRLYSKMNYEISLINDYLEKSVTGYVDLEVDSFKFIELKKIGEQSTSLIKKRNQSEKRIELIVNTIPDVIFIMDPKGVFLECEAGNETLFQVNKRDLVGKSVYDIFSKEVADSCIKKINEALETKTMITHEIHIDNANSYEYYEVRLIVFREKQVFTIVRNITELKKAQLNNEYLIYYDHLTGVYNRRFFEEELNRLDIKRNLPLSIIMGDINGLKLINDSFGHNIGDDYLKKTAEIIKKACRSDEIVSRLGGDEFAIILPKTTASDATKVTNRINEMILEEEVGNIKLSISFGYSTKENEEQSIQKTMETAENHMYTHKIVERSSMRSKAVEIIMSTLFEKSARESQHSKRVSLICEAIAIKMSLEKDDINQIRTVGLVHDIGKIGVEESILNKNGRLDDDEWEKMKKHPEAGWRILNATDEFSEIAKVVLHHHERFDGSGYPYGLKGDEIPMEAKIVSIADAYDAMTSDRSYRKALSKKEAIEEIQRCSGAQFDPAIAELLIEKVLSEKNL